jgi:hypothetical protein
VTEGPRISATLARIDSLWSIDIARSMFRRPRPRHADTRTIPTAAAATSGGNVCNIRDLERAIRRPPIKRRHTARLSILLRFPHLRSSLAPAFQLAGSGSVSVQIGLNPHLSPATAAVSRAREVAVALRHNASVARAKA